MEELMQEVLGFAPTTGKLKITLARLKTLLGYDPFAGNYTESIEVCGNKVFLAAKNISEITSIMINGAPKDLSTLSRISDRQYVFNVARYERPIRSLVKGQIVLNNPDILTITYKAGWTPDTVPEDLTYAMCMIYNDLFSDNTLENLSSYKIDTIAYTWKNESEVAAKLAGILAEYTI